MDGPSTHRRKPMHRTGATYGLSPEQIDELVLRAEGRCEGCGVITVLLVFDHCHATGIVRGLLCTVCNSTLGRARDSAERLLGLAVYLEQDGTVPDRPARKRVQDQLKKNQPPYRWGRPVPLPERFDKARRERRIARVKATPADAS